MTTAVRAARISADGGDVLKVIAIEITHGRACEYHSLSAKNILLLAEAAGTVIAEDHKARVQGRDNDTWQLIVGDSDC